MNLFATTDITASVRKALDSFTHVSLARSYYNAHPVFYATGSLIDLPLFQYSKDVPATHSQLTRWEALGGVLIEAGRAVPEHDMRPDVTVMIDCPLSMFHIEKFHMRNMEYGVIPRPGSWKTADDTVEMLHPQVDVLLDIWPICRGQSMTVAELSRECGIPAPVLAYVKNAFKPQERWNVHKRLAPERDEMVPAWDWVDSKEYAKKEIVESGFTRMLEEMARFGYIQLKKYFVYPTDDPDWRDLDRRREAALTDLAAVRSLVESLPDHLEVQAPSDESP
jgi:hypothetical protein